MVADLVVVGHGIAGLARALAAATQGLDVVVIDRDAEATGASVRNRGLVTVTGQQEGLAWRRALRGRAIWSEVVEPARIAIEHAGLLVTERRPEPRSGASPVGGRRPASFSLSSLA